jgi:hypothetical protein
MKITSTIIAVTLILVLHSFVNNEPKFYVPIAFYNSVLKGDTTNYIHLKPVRCISLIRQTWFLDGFRCYNLYGAESIHKKPNKDSTIYRIKHPTTICKEDLGFDVIGFWGNNKKIFIVVYKNNLERIKLCSVDTLNNKKITIDFIKVPKKPKVIFGDKNTIKVFSWWWEKW